MISKKQVQDLIKKKENVRGSVIMANLEFLRRRGGEVAIKKLKEKWREFELSPDLLKIKPMEFYPEGISVFLVLIAREILDLDDEGVFEMGRAGMKLSFFLKIISHYFSSFKKCFKESPKYWEKHFDFGRIEPVELNEEEKKVIIRVIGYNYHPTMCLYHRGYFLQLTNLIIGGDRATIEETKCTHKGDLCHEYIISWN